MPPPQTTAGESQALEGYEASDERSASDEDESRSPWSSGSLRYSDIAANLRYLDELRTSPIPIPSDFESDTSSMHATYTPTSTQPSPVRNFFAVFEGRDDFGNPLLDDSSLSKESPECSSRKAKGS